MNFWAPGKKELELLQCFGGGCKSAIIGKGTRKKVQFLRRSQQAITQWPGHKKGPFLFPCAHFCGSLKGPLFDLWAMVGGKGGIFRGDFANSQINENLRWIFLGILRRKNIFPSFVLHVRSKEEGRKRSAREIFRRYSKEKREKRMQKKNPLISLQLHFLPVAVHRNAAHVKHIKVADFHQKK